MSTMRGKCHKLLPFCNKRFISGFVRDEEELYTPLMVAGSW